MPPRAIAPQPAITALKPPMPKMLNPMKDWSGEELVFGAKIDHAKYIKPEILKRTQPKKRTILRMRGKDMDHHGLKFLRSIQRRSASYARALTDIWVLFY